MASPHLSIRVDARTLKMLDDASKSAGQSRSALAKMLIEEGLRMEKHPGIIFKPGPAGRRPALIAGPDVWEVMRVFLSLESKGEQAVRETAEIGSLQPWQVHLAIGYYADYQDEIDEWIRSNDEEADRAYASWLKRQELLHA